MSDDDRAPGPEPAPVRPPMPALRGSPSTGNIVGGVFLIGCGLCLLLAGGSCTVLLVMLMTQPNSGSNGTELGLPVAVLIVGLVALVIGIRLVTKRSGG
ncbi:MAG: hypothetical protein QOH81_2340 [Sphingomonadales bacterium]|jgi:hypothetical protein|nr:hypothetical protein [Sphingomonadales bacterium]